MNLIKKNIVLFSVLGVTLIASGIFTYMVIQETDEMNKAALQVEELKDKINELNKQTPIPNKKNYDRILADAGFISEKTKELNTVFGKPYLAAAHAFTKALGVPYEDFVKQWGEAYDNDKNAPRDLFFSKFFAKYDKDKVESAIEAFYKQIEKESLEPLNQANVDDSIMEAFGFPRTIQPISCKTYMMDMQDNFLAYAAEKKNGEKPLILGTGIPGNSVEKFTFDKFEGGALPRPDEVAYIFKNLKLIEDLLFRLKKSGVKSLDAITKENLKGERKGDYLLLTYTITVTAPLNNIRKFMNSLLEAYKQNRIYVVRSVVLTAKEDVSTVVKIEKAKKDGTSRYHRYNTQKEPEEDIQNSMPGVPIMGNDDTVTAKIKFEYVIYVGDELMER